MPSSATDLAPPSPDELTALFAAPAETTLSVGLEEELMLLDADTLDLAPTAERVLAAANGDPRFVGELSASQLEIVLPATSTVAGAAEALRDARRDLAGHAAPCTLAGAGVHPFTTGQGMLRGQPIYERFLEEYLAIARRQLICGLHVHVALRGCERVIAVYNHLREYLPLLAAAGANAPFYEGTDTGLASIRPVLSGLLPRQGVPPSFASVAAYAQALRWSHDAGRIGHLGAWWWELRLHLRHGTVEVRVCDTQSTVEETLGLAALVRCLVAWLAERHDAGEELPVAPEWRIRENRWLACRYGLDARLADPRTAETATARERLCELLAEVEPVAARIGETHTLGLLDTRAPRNGADRMRAAAAGDARRATRWLTERFA